MSQLDRALASGIVRLAFDLVGYGAVSVIALCCDCALLLAMTEIGVHYLAASLLSFSAGSVVAYLLCTRFVFAARRRQARRAELVGFFAIGLMGLVMTQGLLWIFVSRLAWPIALAKIPTVGLVFLANFLGRRSFVFSAA